MAGSPTVVDVLRSAQQLGMLGARPIDQAVEHSRGFVDALAPFEGRLVDLGSGGGLPGLVLAEAFPTSSILLIDRREKRTDFLRRAVRSLGWEHVEVRCADVDQLVRSVVRGQEPPFDAVTARGFGPPAVTLRWSAKLIAPGGRIVISEPPLGDRWPPELLAELGLRGERAGAVRRFSVPSS